MNLLGAPSKTYRILLTLGRVLLAGVLLYAVYAKLDNPAGTVRSLDPFRLKIAVAAFGIAIAKYEVLPESITGTVAYVVIGLEFCLGLWLLIGKGARWAAAGASALLAFFFTLMFRAYLLGQAIDCGCFGPGDQLGPKTLTRDALLLTVALLVTWGSFKMARKAPPSSKLPSEDRLAPAETQKVQPGEYLEAKLESKS